MIESKGTVQILMSTYNGEHYIEEQIDSLLGQTYPEIEIIIRDDGSGDNTRQILRRYASEHNNIRVIEGDNLGVTESFFELLRASDADFVAFCDQDDIWLENKIEAAVDKIGNGSKPVMYCSNTILVDAEGKLIAPNDFSYKEPSFENAVVENICTGCTIVMNRPLADNIRTHLPKQAIMHDRWFYLVATYVGEVIYDRESYIHYRQHGNNEVGASKNPFKVMKGQMKHLKKNKSAIRRQLTEFASLYHSDETKDEIVKQITETPGFHQRVAALFHCRFKRQRGLDQIITELLFLFHRL
ncbi:MAG: glycosyltransferase family 2 protein [Lachnospiraceae bacterium]|nr:glycosyltransferase family 2 protein [Lachnospiraceae bacterium]